MLHSGMEEGLNESNAALDKLVASMTWRFPWHWMETILAQGGDQA